MKPIIYTGNALKQLKKHGNMRSRIITALEEYATDPKAHANQIIQLVGQTEKRLRVGDFRILLDETQDQITVIKIGPRENFYD